MNDLTIEGIRITFNTPELRRRWKASVEQMRIQVDEKIEKRDKGRAETATLAEQIIYDSQTAKYAAA